MVRPWCWWYGPERVNMDARYVCFLSRMLLSECVGHTLRSGEICLEESMFVVVAMRRSGLRCGPSKSFHDQWLSPYLAQSNMNDNISLRPENNANVTCPPMQSPVSLMSVDRMQHGVYLRLPAKRPLAPNPISVQLQTRRHARSRIGGRYSSLRQRHVDIWSGCSYKMLRHLYCVRRTFVRIWMLMRRRDGSRSARRGRSATGPTMQYTRS